MEGPGDTLDADADPAVDAGDDADDGSGALLEYRWADAVEGFDMPVDVRLGDAAGDGAAACARSTPTAEWQSLEITLDEPADFGVDRDFYVLVRALEAAGPAAETRVASAVCSG